MNGYAIAAGEAARTLERFGALQFAHLLIGGEMTIPLNGGSDTRRAAREAHRERADALGLGFEGKGCLARTFGPTRNPVLLLAALLFAHATLIEPEETNE